MSEKYRELLKLEIPNLEQLQKRITEDVLLEAHRVKARALAVKRAGEVALDAVSGRTVERKALEDSLSRFGAYMDGTSDEFNYAFWHGSRLLDRFVESVDKTYKIDVAPLDLKHRQVQLNGGSMLLNIDPQFTNGLEQPPEYFYNSVRDLSV